MRHVDKQPLAAAHVEAGSPAVSGASCSRMTATPLTLDRSDIPAPVNARERLVRAALARFALLRSSPFRIGMVFWLLFCSTVGVTGYSFYSALQQRTVDHLDGTLDLRHKIVAGIYEQQGIEGVEEHLLRRLEKPGPMRESLGYALFAPNGERVLSNITTSAGTVGYHEWNGKTLGVEDVDSTYRFLNKNLGDYQLSIGRSLEPLSDLRAVALNCLMWALGVSMVLSILAAVWISRWFDCRLSGLSSTLARVADGELNQRVPVSYAVDDVDIMSLQINAALDRLEDNVDSIREVSTDIAHDLKTPLNRLYSYLDDASRQVDAFEGSAGEVARESLEQALSEAEHINATFEALLRVSQVEAGSLKAQFKPVNLADIVATACEVFEPVAEASGQVLGNHIATTADLPVTGDTQLLLQMTVNVIENAINHCPEGVAINIDGGLRDGKVWLAISDTGPGIPEDKREKVFQRLYRLETSRTTPGSGLGLSMVKAIANVHGAEVALHDNDPGLKVEFSFNPVPSNRRTA